jgi:hypothetical protein
MPYFILLFSKQDESNEVVDNINEATGPNEGIIHFSSCMCDVGQEEFS